MNPGSELRGIPQPYNLFDIETSSDIASNGHTERLFPITPLDENSNGPIRFDIPGTSDFVDFRRTYLRLVGKMTGEIPAVSGTTTTTPARKVGESGVDRAPINLLPHALFTSVEVLVNNVNLTGGDQNYMYRAYFDTLFDYNKDVLKTSGALMGWVKDDPDNMDNTSPAPNNALGKRNARKNSKHEYFYCIHPITTLFQSEKLMIPHCDIKVSLQKNPESKFYLMHPAGGKFKFEITEAILHVRKVTVNPDYYASVLKRMESDNTPVEYILNAPRIITTNLHKDERYFNRENITFGHLPRRILVGMVETEAYTGSSVKNPFNFKHFDLSRISIMKNGLEYPVRPITPTFENHDYADAYKMLMSSVDAEISPFCPNITEHDFANGFTIYSYDMSPDQYGDMIHSNHQNKSANIRLSIEFAKPLPVNVTLIIYCLSEMKLTIDKTKQVTLETSFL